MWGAYLKVFTQTHIQRFSPVSGVFTVSGFRCWYLIWICLIFQRKCFVYLLICDSLEEVTSPDENRFSQVTLWVWADKSHLRLVNRPSPVYLCELSPFSGCLSGYLCAVVHASLRLVLSPAPPCGCCATFTGFIWCLVGPTCFCETPWLVKGKTKVVWGLDNLKMRRWAFQIMSQRHILSHEQLNIKVWRGIEEDKVYLESGLVPRVTKCPCNIFVFLCCFIWDFTGRTLWQIKHGNNHRG